MKEGGNITILLLGDEQVGKSSLASTFVSRHFSEQVPGILTRVRLPPDPSLSKCTTTIIDTQEGDTILSNALFLSGNNRESLLSISSKADSISITYGKPNVASNVEDSMQEGVSENRRSSSITSTSGKQESAAEILATSSQFRGVDAIILVYDLDRIDTFHRLEDHWLPLIDQCYNGDLPVIIAGNKMDLATDSDGQNSPARQQIISLLQRFKFVRQCIKCSAKKLLNVDEVFCKSQESVLYPICPLYDLTSGNLTEACSNAFTRIFRMFDLDRDGLLSDKELNAFQQKVWGISLTEKDFTGWKKMVAQHRVSGADEVDDAIRDGKFTLAGFLTIFDVLITSQNRLEVPWKVLRALGYDDKLNLSIPASISHKGGKSLEFSYLHPDDWRLSSFDIEFLTSIFLQFDSAGDGTLSATDIHSIFSVLPYPHPSWAECRSGLFRDHFSFPHIEDEATLVSPGATVDQDISSSPRSHPSSPSSIISASGITITSSPLPSVDISKDSDFLYLRALSENKPISFLSWMNRWHMVCTISPSLARSEMYKLGHVFKPKSPRINLSSVGSVASHVPAVIDMPSTFVRAVVLGSKDSGKGRLVQKLHRWHCSYTETEYPATSCSVSKIIRPNSTSTTTWKGTEHVVHVILTLVPALDMSSDTEKQNLRNKLDILLGQNKFGKKPYDMAVLAFDATNMQSLEFAKELESDVLSEEMPRVYVGTTIEAMESNSKASSRECEAIREAHEHCKAMEIEPPLIISIDDETKLDSSVLEHLVSCAQDERQVVVSFRSTPHGERKRRQAKMRKVLWIGGLVTAGITVVLGLTITGKKKIASSSSEGGGGWLRFFQQLLPF